MGAVGGACCQQSEDLGKVEIDQTKVIPPAEMEAKEVLEPPKAIKDPEPAPDPAKEREEAEAKRKAEEEEAARRKAAEEKAKENTNAPAPAPAAAAAPEPKKEEVGIPVDFAVGGSTRTVVVCKKPLGMVFGKTQPLTVTQVVKGSHCDELGVQVGWVCKTIAGQDISSMRVEDAADLAMSKMQSLPQSSNSVTLVFDAQGSDKTVIVSRRPFGATVQQGPLKVLKVTENGHADKLRVQVGWTIKSIAGEDVSKLDDAAATAAFQKAISALPQV